MLRLGATVLTDELQEILIRKWRKYQSAHPEEKITLHDFAKLILEMGIRFIDVDALD